ncbi:UNVERIFIED_CONTAM: hypothetical protein Q9R58_04235 [Methylobacteriaceae bacterium AG10]|uniref:Uncharacterized protein n=1 Tax=Methylorubrum podarium TaxID=200476 RepID=A0ABV1QQ08_9HYPH|nr:hypothetical protein [Methylobacteriaceae bacterium AG10]
MILMVGTGDATARQGHSTPRLKTYATWKMPWQLSLSSAASRAKGERTIVARLPKYGKVRGTRVALRYVFAPLPKTPGRNSLVRACRSTVAQSARKLGAVRIDAASAGPERRTRSGSVAKVGFRLIYASHNTRENYEVRQGVLTCRADRAGKIVDAYA